MRMVELDGAPIDDAFETAMNECVQCRGCEAACPSSVQFGHLMEHTRAALHESPQRGSNRHGSYARRALEWIGYRLVLPNHWLLMAVTWLAWLGQRLRLVPRRFALPQLSARSLATPVDAPRGGAPDAWLFTGCVMDAWLRDTHRSTVRVMRAAGVHDRSSGSGWRLLRRAAHARRPDARSRGARPPRDALDARRRARSWSTARAAAPR